MQERHARVLELESSLPVLQAQHASVAEPSLGQDTEVHATSGPVIVTQQYPLVPFACLVP